MNYSADTILLAFPIRLAGGSTHYSGRVEVYRNGVWGTVCDDSWNIVNARVVCQQLFGFGSSPSTYSLAVSAGSGAIVMDNVNCSNDQTNLLACSHNGFGNHDCGHEEDVGVTCLLRPSASEH